MQLNSFLVDWSLFFVNMHGISVELMQSSHNLHGSNNIGTVIHIWTFSSQCLSPTLLMFVGGYYYAHHLVHMSAYKPGPWARYIVSDIL